MRFWLLTLAFLAFVIPAQISAQDAVTPAQPLIADSQSALVLTEEGLVDFSAWGRLADRVERALDAGRASDHVMQQLRAELADWRSGFLAAQGENDIRINTLTTQISTLGPPPGEGGSEPAILTIRRDELTGQLNDARAPVQRASEAYGRADVLIGEIDTLLRTRLTDALFTFGPSPVLPSNWPEAYRNLSNTLSLAINGIGASFGTETQKAELRRDLPLTILLGIIGLVLLVRGRAWVMRLVAGVSRNSRGPLRGIMGFVISLGQVVAPLLGIILLIEALNLAGVLDLRGQTIVDTLPLVGLSFFGALWLGNRVFGAGPASTPAISLTGPLEAAQARLSMALLGLIFGLRVMLVAISLYEDYSQVTLVVLEFPLLLAAGLLLFRLGRILRRFAREQAASEAGVSLRSRLISILGRALVLLAILGPLAAAIGYTPLAREVTYPVILTLGIIAALEVAHLLFVDIYGFLTKRDAKSAGDALVPILASFALVLASIPLLALVWGARVTDLTELWTTVMLGFQLGDTRFTPRTFLSFVVVFAIGYIATRVIQGTLKTTILPKTRLDKGGQNAISAGIGYTGIFLAAMIAITSAGIDLSSLAIVAGALSVGIGFGLQNVVSNFVAGIILLIERPISEGDWIEVGGEMGYVRDISVRSTRIETFDRTDVIVPNADLISNQVTNFTRGNLIGRVIVKVGVAYGSDTRRIESILREIAEAHPLVTISPSPSVVFQGFGADALDFEIRAILKDVNFILSVKSDINHEIARRFVEEGIEIPFAQRDIWLRNPEALTGAASPKTGAPETSAAEARAGLEASDMHDGGEGDE